MTDLKKMGELDDTLIVVTADHGHGFVSDYRRAFLTNCGTYGFDFDPQDVFGSADTKYLTQQSTDILKRRAGKSKEF